VEDDGIGFSPNPSGEGLGLAGLEERIASLAGRMEIASTPSGGTALRMMLPV
jgi:signal transduction histidine kinase